MYNEEGKHMNSEELKINQRAECIARMTLLGMDKWAMILNTFKTTGEIWTSHDPAGILTRGDETTETAVQYLAQVSPDSMPYHAIDGTYTFPDGEKMHFVTLLYVSAHMEEWELDRDDLTTGRPIAYVYNAGMPMFSEFGSVGIAENDHAQALRRTY